MHGLTDHADVLLVVAVDGLGHVLIAAMEWAAQNIGWVFFVISLARPHVRCTPMGRTCRRADGIELTPMRLELNG